MIDADDINKARKIIAEEIKSYTDEGIGEIATCRYLAEKKYNCYWGALQQLANKSLKSIKKSVETAEKILEKQNETNR
jgi:hypothetical protein|tara:strand:+ start:68 stop:301 length:234 start_codon:yes stop_codon:yes gene_type:complete